MTIQDVAAKMTKKDWELWAELVAEAESQCLELDAIKPGAKTFHHISGEAFRLERDGMKVIVTRRPAHIAWTHINRVTPGIMSTKESHGVIDMIDGAFWFNRQRFLSAQDVALYLIDRLTLAG